MKKNKNLVVVTLLLIALLAYGSVWVKPINVKADSGFDSSYSSGGSSSSSSWSSSSSSSSSSWSSSSSSSSGEPITVEDFVSTLIGFIIFTVVVIIIIKYGYKNNSIQFTMPTFELDHNKEVDDDVVRKFIPGFNKNAFLNDRFNDFVNIQNSWMNFNYNELRASLTDELYNQYEMQLDTLKAKGEKNVMTNYIHVDSMITGINSENGKITVTMEMIATFIDYIEHNGLVVRGNVTTPIKMHYELVYVLSATETNDVCPNCGAKITNSASQECEYCGSKIAKIGSKAVLSKKRAIRQQ